MKQIQSFTLDESVIDRLNELYGETREKSDYVNYVLTKKLGLDKTRTAGVKFIEESLKHEEEKQRNAIKILK